MSDALHAISFVIAIACSTAGFVIALGFAAKGNPYPLLCVGLILAGVLHAHIAAELR